MQCVQSSSQPQSNDELKVTRSSELKKLLKAVHCDFSKDAAAAGVHTDVSAFLGVIRIEPV